MAGDKNDGMCRPPGLSHFWKAAWELNKSWNRRELFMQDKVDSLSEKISLQ